MEKEMEKEKSIIIILVNYYLKEKEMGKEKNIIIKLD